MRLGFQDGTKSSVVVSAALMVSMTGIRASAGLNPVCAMSMRGLKSSLFKPAARPISCEGNTLTAEFPSVVIG
jgi:hypothetical protein